jgi:hypothetical protein
MRITRETLMKIVRDTVAQRTRSDRGVVAIYLCGSLLGDDFLLGGTADIDLVILHADTIAAEREIVPLTDDVHLDIAHHMHKDYRQARSLRVHPWLGPTLFSCHILYDPQHFMDFTQASVRGQFDRSDYVLVRAGKQLEHARQMWSSLHTNPVEPGEKEVSLYLRAIEHAINAVAILSGPPLTERRFLLSFSGRAEAVGRPGLYAGLLGMLGGPHVDGETLRAWVPVWASAYSAIPTATAPARLHPGRRSYYQRSFESLLEKQPLAILWPLLHTWTQAISVLPDDSTARQGWRQAFEYLGLLGKPFAERVQAFDAYLDLIEETLENWGRENGANFES